MLNDTELSQITKAVVLGVREAIPCCKVFNTSEIASVRNVIKIEGYIKGWVLYSIAVGIATPGFIAAIFLILRYLKVI